MKRLTDVTRRARLLLPLVAALWIHAAFAQLPDASFASACIYSPNDPVFAKGHEHIAHVKHGSQDVYTIRLPDVTVNKKSYREIVIRRGDSFHIDACGCVQTGGSGLTWKRYVDPSVDRSDSFKYPVYIYTGMIYPGPFQTIPQDAGIACCQVQSISQWLTAQQRGVKFVATQDFEFTLGYADDNYGDNGYWKHDDGTEGQCRGIGAAAVQVRIDRSR